ncbi:hypothetical protein [Streptomyces sp. NPDC004286]|uniref:hypothetical protein n=1 Tax=Streptomyces sp. NPDC004286 TaxID=3364696 RepID=UPI00368622E3
MSKCGYLDLTGPDDFGKPLREEVAREIYTFDAIACEPRTRELYLRVADHVLELVAQRGIGTGPLG